MRRWLALAVLLATASCAAHRTPTGRLTAQEHNDLGVAHFERGEPRRAAQEFERALELRPDWARALVNLGDARLALGEVASAIEAYRRAVTIAPDDAAAANNLAWALLQDPVRWPEAEPVIQDALARHPAPRGYYLDTLGAVLLKKGDSRAALTVFREALADPGLTDGRARALVLDHTADAHAHLGDSAAASRCRELAASVRSGGAGAASSVGDRTAVC